MREIYKKSSVINIIYNVLANFQQNTRILCSNLENSAVDNNFNMETYEDMI